MGPKKAGRASQIVFTSGPPRYSQAVKAAGLVFVSGTSPADPVTGELVGVTIQEQTRQCPTNVAAVLEAAGSALDRLVSVTVVLADEDDFAGMNEGGSGGFPAIRRPAREPSFPCAFPA